MSASAPVILFDGVCNFCNATVNFVLDRDVGGVFRFASIQSAAGQRILRQYGLEDVLEPGKATMVLIQDDKAYVRSSAALRVAGKMSAPWSWARIFLAVPAPVRDAVYGFVSDNRYRLMGKAETCRIPTPELKARILEA